MVPRLGLVRLECGGASGQQGSGVEKAEVGCPEMATRYCQALKDKIVLTVLETVKFHDE